ncbi:OPA3 domain protein [Drepanopeziza brunnea f. sp. 'multigermtubi' MB_m1]|uniref:OPA3 domain protein n=1 Tax=Marssonina brunnea f. sp. multigermtubi (strain MB_m1) TaxID=1072389 RepID=K1WSZ8_MARBU|nr:OPA3 domain protein [Drepanopeziza brunnea f. sp. 'multigermtubi' MB_m1]EKD15552.1 OPA3 domain protein [Drepanopeziza brunnea f. sp. 'multigermtubi' MB_m1]
MVPLPLFKFAALFVRHISKYGANYIKAQAHDHPKFRTYAARYGQGIHQLNMRLTVTLLRDKAAEKLAKERAEAPTVKTEEQMRHDEAQKEKNAAREKASHQEASKSIWRRRFRPLPEAKAVDLFADVIGDSFILLVAGGLIIYEYVRAKGKPDANAEKIAELNRKLEELDFRERRLEEVEKEQEARVETLEQAIEVMRQASSKKKSLLPHTSK